MIKNALQYVMMGLVAYYAVSMIVLNIRHPWMTGMELIIHTWDGLTWQHVDYWETRPRP